MEGIRKQVQPVPLDVDRSDAFRTIREEVTLRRSPDAGAAMQYLTWALEEIEKAGDQKAAHHTRAAITALRNGIPPAASQGQGTLVFKSKHRREPK